MTDLNQITRKNWARTIAEILLRNYDRAMLVALVAGGEALFVKRAAIAYSSQDLTRDDLRAIYRRIERVISG